MAQQESSQNTPKIGFKIIELLKDQTLGIGGFGSVCKAQCDNLLCAAKIIHPTLFDPNAHRQVERNKEHRLPIQRFMKECEFMSAIKHPNIVQFLGTHQDLQTGLPVLLMELMDNSLTHFLESSKDAVPYDIQVNFCHDITLAISYLHSNEIVHRDLSSNNVLLYGTVKAKVSDFGMATLSLRDENLQATKVSLTMCPGTDVYMPPEAVKDIPVYTEKIDCFAIGTLIIQILTRSFPNPGRRRKIIEIDHPQFPGGTVDVPVPEIERRQNHISLVDPNHPLLPIALDCLKDSDVKRPSALELCHRVAALKETPQFTESHRRAQERPEPAGNNTADKEKETTKLQQQVQNKDQLIKEKEEIIKIHSKEISEMRSKQAQQIQVIRSQNETITEITREKDDIIQKKDDEMRQLHEKLQLLQDVIDEKDDSIRQKDQLIEKQTREIKANMQQQTQIKEPEEQPVRHKPSSAWFKRRSRSYDTTARPTIQKTFKMTWRDVERAPYTMYRTFNAVVIDHLVYFLHDTQKICTYNSKDKVWSRLPQCEMHTFSLTIVNNLPTTIGGITSDGKRTNKLTSLTEDGENRISTWVEQDKELPPMATERSSAGAICIGRALIVAGGIKKDKKKLKTVEILDLDAKNWSSATSIPEPLTSASLIACDEQIYITGAWYEKQATKSVYTCTLSDLLETTPRQRSATRSLSLTSFLKSTTWKKLSDLPVTDSTLVTVHNRLLAIGGCDSKGTVTSDVCIYHPISDRWEVISKMNTSRQCCFAAVLPTNELMVVGGCTTSSLDNATNSVEIASIDIALTHT